MIGLDTNILVRYLAQDDRQQAEAASRLIEETLNAEAPGFVSAAALVEVAWVLEDGYGCSRGEVVSVFERLLHVRQLVVERAEALAQATRAFAAGKADFADCVIERIGHVHGCEYTLTFDRLAARDAGMRLLPITS